MLILATAILSTASFATDLKWHPDPAVRLMKAFVDHYHSVPTLGHVQGQCEGRLTLSDYGYLTSIDLKCPSDEVRQAVYQRLAAAVPFPPLPPGVRQMWGTF
jgi:hypothetical protein